MNDVFTVLMAQLPEWFKPVLEFIEIMKAYAGPLSDAETLAQEVHDNFFIQTADAETISKWEAFFGLTVQYGDTLEYRRQRVLQKMIQIVPYTIWSFRERLTVLYGAGNFSVTEDSENCTLTINVYPGSLGDVALLWAVIWDVVPAHLIVYANHQETVTIGGDAYIGANTTRTLIQTLGG